jgi:thioredoxin reductase
MPEPERKILERMAVPPGGVYVLGCFASRLTFASQQCRALNLIHALFREGILSTGDTVAVVGAGLAGLTAAVAASQKGCEVTIFELAGKITAMQRGNYVRFIHPNVLDWPNPVSGISGTRWPFLNWEAAPVDGVVSQIEEEWNRFSQQVTIRFRHKVEEIDTSRGVPRIRAKPLDSELGATTLYEFKCVILAVGFGLERSLRGVPSRSYWTNDDLHQEVPAAEHPRNVLVTGCGDGGLIDVLRLKIRSFVHAEFVASVFNDEQLRATRDDLIRIEEAALRLPGGESSDFLAKEYANLNLPLLFEERFLSVVRNDINVTLNGQALTPLTRNSSILHRFTTFLLWKYKRLEYVSGKLLSVAADPDGYNVNLQFKDGSCEVRRFDQVVVRHGPEDVVRRLIPKTAAQSLCEKWRSVPDPTIRPIWDKDSFASASRAAAVDCDRERAANNNLLRALAVLESEPIFSIRVGRVGDQFGYIVIPLKEDYIPQHTQLMGFPVIYDPAPVLSKPADAQPPKELCIGAFICCGTGRDKRCSTLGCFVIFERNEVGFLSTSHILLPEGGEARGVQIFHGTPPGKEDRVVAIMRSHMSLAPSPANLREKKVLNIMDVAGGVLLPGIKYRPQFPQELQLPRLVDAATPRLGDRVFKVGARSGLTFGHVVSISATMAVFQSGNPFWIRNTFAIEPEASTAFSNHGDSGSIIVRQEGADGVVLGMLIGSDQRNLTYAFPIQPALEAMNCKLLLKDTFRTDWKALCST